MKINGSAVGWLLEKVKRNIENECKKPRPSDETIEQLVSRINYAAMKVFDRHCPQTHSLVALTMEAYETYLDEEFWPANPVVDSELLRAIKSYENFLANDFKKIMTEKFKVEYPLSYDQL